MLIFLACGAGLFAVDAALRRGAEPVRGDSAEAVREEVLVREAVARGLDQNDPVIRSRLAQKMEFVLAEGAELAEPTDDEVRQFFEAHRERYRPAPLVSFSARVDGGVLELNAQSPVEVATRFGAPFAQALAALDGGSAVLPSLSGPVEVTVRGREQPTTLDFEAAKDAARGDVLDERRRAVESAGYRELEKKYGVAK